MNILKSIIFGAAAFAAVTSHANAASNMEIIRDPAQSASGPYSQAIKANGFIFLSGVIALNSATKEFAEPKIGPQTIQIFENIKGILAASGATLEDVVKVQVFLKDPADFKPMNEVYKTYFKDHKPTRTTVPGVDWGHPKIIMEIDIIAVAK